MCRPVLAVLWARWGSAVKSGRIIIVPMVYCSRIAISPNENNYYTSRTSQGFAGTRTRTGGKHIEVHLARTFREGKYNMTGKKSGRKIRPLCRVPTHFGSRDAAGILGGRCRMRRVNQVLSRFCLITGRPARIDEGSCPSSVMTLIPCRELQVARIPMEQRTVAVFGTI